MSLSRYFLEHYNSCIPIETQIVKSHVSSVNPSLPGPEAYNSIKASQSPLKEREQEPQDITNFNTRKACRVTAGCGELPRAIGPGEQSLPDWGGGGKYQQVWMKGSIASQEGKRKRGRKRGSYPSILDKSSRRSQIFLMLLRLAFITFYAPYLRATIFE